MEKHICTRCGCVTDKDLFYRKRRRGQWVYLYCLPCRDEIKGEYTLEAQLRKKGSGTIRTHARAHGMDRKQFADKYHWVVELLVADMLRAYEGICPYCRRSFKKMGHGLFDLTADIHDPNQAPHYATNVRWICSSCNRKKGKMGPDKWARYLGYYEKWEDRQEELQRDPLKRYPLFA